MKTRTSDRHLRWLVLIPAGAAILAVLAGVFYWFITPDVRLLSRLMTAAYPPYFYWMALCETAFSLRARSFFSPGQTLRAAWAWFALAGFVRLVGLLLSYALPFPQSGRLVGGLFVGLLNFLAMVRVMEALRQANWRQPLKTTDRVILGILGVYLIHHISLIIPEVAREGLHRPVRNALWLVGPLLPVLAWQALSIRRAMLALGTGRLAQCWSAVAASVLLLVAGNIANSLSRC